MSLHNKNILIGVSVLLAFIGIGVFGLFQFNHTHQSMEVPMGNCPYAQNGYAICKNNLNHVSAWYQFSNITFSSFFNPSLLILGLVLYFIGKQNFLDQKRHFYKWKYYLDNNKLFTQPQKIIKWLSLLINSPSFSY